MRVLHLVPRYRSHVRAHALGGVSTAAMMLASLDADHRVASGLDGADTTSCDALHLHHALAWEALAGRFDGRTAPPVIKTIHVLQRRQNRLRGAESTRSEAAQSALLLRADRLTIATGAARAMLVEDHPEVTDLDRRLVTLPLVPPLSTPRPVRHEVSPLVVAVGRFDRLKGTDLLVAVVAQLLAARSDLRVVVAGGLPDHPKYERRWLASFRERIPADAQERFVFLGWLDATRLAELFGKATVHLAPSGLETCGLAVMEGLAAGCPTVATDIPAHREVAGDAALLVPAEAAAMIEATLALVDDPDYASTLGRRGPARLPERGRVVSQWLHFWDQTR